MSSSVPTPANINSSSTSNPKVVAVSGERVLAGKYNLPVSQAISLPEVKHEILIVPSSSQPSFSGYFLIDIRDINIQIHNITLQFGLGPVVGSSTLAGYFNPAWFFIDHIDVVQAGNIIQTLYAPEQFLMNQLLEFDEDRLSNNNAAGNYSSVLQRTALSSQTASNVFNVNLKSYIDQIHMNLLQSSQNIQLRINMDSLANNFTVTAGTLTSCAINYCNAVCKITRLDPFTSQQRLGDMIQRKQHYLFHDLYSSIYTVQAGLSSTSIILSGITGHVSALFFVVRSSTSGNQKWNFKQIQSFAILNSASTNIVGGQVLPSSMCSNILNRDWCKSSYNTETSFGINDQNANFYCWAFSADIVSALNAGQALGTHTFTGNEQLQINFGTALTGQVQIDCYAKVESILEVSTSGVKKSSSASV